MITFIIIITTVIFLFIVISRRPVNQEGILMTEFHRFKRIIMHSKSILLLLCVVEVIKKLTVCTISIVVPRRLQLAQIP